MAKIRFRKAVPFAFVAALLLECSGGLPEEDDASGGNAGSAGQASGGARAQGGTHSGAGAAGMAGISTPSETSGGAAGATSIASGGIASGGVVGSGGEPTAGGAAGAPGEIAGGVGGGGAGAGGESGAGAPGAGGSAGHAGSTGGAHPAGGTLGGGGTSGRGGASGGTAGTCASKRQCDSSADNDCAGGPDNQEAPCKVCSVGTAHACNTHPEDGKGLCKAGSQTCVLSSDHASVEYSACSGDVGPTQEACGPFLSDATTKTPDANCNGIGGDGDFELGSDCATSVSILGKTVHLFTTARPGTVPIHRCDTPCPVTAPLFSYIALSCGSPITKDMVIGYAVTSALPSYAAVNIPASSCMYDGGAYGPQFNIQAPALTFYALP